MHLSVTLQLDVWGVPFELAELKLKIYRLWITNKSHRGHTVLRMGSLV
jgi:hypothetical protein